MAFNIRKNQTPLTGNRTITTPDKSGTIVLDSMLGTVNGQSLLGDIIIDNPKLGTFGTLAELQAAHPTPSAGQYAFVVDPTTGVDTFLVYTWDAAHSEWDHTGSSNLSLADTDGLDEGTANKYFTEARTLETALTYVPYTNGIESTGADSVQYLSAVAPGDSLEKAIRKLALAVNPARSMSAKFTHELDVGAILRNTGDIQLVYLTTEGGGIPTAFNQISFPAYSHTGGFLKGTLGLTIWGDGTTQVGGTTLIDFVIGFDSNYVANSPSIINDYNNPLNLSLWVDKDDLGNGETVMNLAVNVPPEAFGVYSSLLITGAASVTTKLILSN